MAENTEVFCSAAADYIRDYLGVGAEYVTGIPWQERERLFDAGVIHILWLCGLPYVHKADLAENNMELLAVPVPLGARYDDKPVYFSDIVVSSDSRYRNFLDLRGTFWAYNEPRSHSGFNVVRAHLAAIGQPNGFFATTVESGAHSASIEMILSGSVAGAAIDSTVLEWLVCLRPSVAEGVRVIETFGPSPIPPWVISRLVPASLRKEVRELLFGMADESRGRDILARGRIARFVSALDSDYDPIRRMAETADAVSISSAG